MDDIQVDARYPPKHHSINHHNSKPSIRNHPSYPINPDFGKNYDNNMDYDEDDELNEESDGETPASEEVDYQNGYYESEERKKKRRIESLVSNYEFAPRAAANLPRNQFFVRNSREDWSEHETLVLLEVWGDRFMQLGRMSLRSEDWEEVAKNVSQGTQIGRSEIECRNRLGVLKNKYNKERAKMEEMRSGYVSKWVFFKKMDMLLNSRKEKQQCGLACGFDSGEYVFMDSSVYLNRSNVFDEMRDSPVESEDEEDEEEEENEVKGVGDLEGDGSESFSILADSIQKFGEIYEKIETNKRKQIMELEKMRVDFQRELELQKQQTLERVQAEIAKIRQGVDDETDVSSEDICG
ncbi:unnamed protein product [Ilex paraguariensis]|uniref:Myb-like domain-containing protein n=1 Tax=Ilex paraguariensis TaxID=185542 RepID=A0ABC8TSY6_9AQUA